MKKNLSPLFIIGCLMASLNFSCGSDDKVTPASCDNSIDDYTAALNAYIADIENVAKCEALKATLNDLVDCPGLTAGQKADYKAEVDAIDCN